MLRYAFPLVGMIMSSTVFAQSWTQANLDGFGDADNIAIGAAAMYRGSLYAGTANEATGCEVWRYDGGPTWTRVDPGGGFGSPDNVAAGPGAVLDDRLYVGVVNEVSGCEVWRYDGERWASSATGGFGDVANLGINAMGVFNGRLYVGTDKELDPGGCGCEIWELDGGTWQQVNQDGFSSPWNCEAYGLVEYQGELYVGTENLTSGSEVWRYDGVDWVSVAPSGFGAGNEAVRGLAVCNDLLYAGTANPDAGCEVWAHDGARWTPIASNGFGLGSENTDAIVACHDGLLFAATGREGDRKDPPGLARVYRHAGGVSWTQVNTNGFGDPGNQLALSLFEHEGRLHASTVNVDTGAEVWRYCDSDIDGNSQVNVDDLVAVILDWGSDGSANGGDVDGSGLVDVDDLTTIILTWGPCES